MTSRVVESGVRTYSELVSRSKQCPLTVLTVRLVTQPSPPFPASPLRPPPPPPPARVPIYSLTFPPPGLFSPIQQNLPQVSLLEKSESTKKAVGSYSHFFPRSECMQPTMHHFSGLIFISDISVLETTEPAMTLPVGDVRAQKSSRWVQKTMNELLGRGLRHRHNS